MLHFEDLDIYEIIDLIDNLKNCGATIKLDGTCAITFGFDDAGKFYTAFGRDFRKIETWQRKYSVQDWMDRKIIMVNPGVFAHVVLEKHYSVLRQILNNNEPVVAEVLFVDQPNCIRYRLSGISRLVIINHGPLSRALENTLGSVIVPEWYLSDFDVIQRIANKLYKFEPVLQCPIPDLDISTDPIKTFLNNATNGIKNSEYVIRRAVGREKERILELRKIIDEMKLGIKDKLLKDFVSKIKGSIEPEAGFTHEGVVLLFKGKYIKIVDKDGFTKMHERDWAPAMDAKRIRLQVCKGEILKEDGLKQIKNLLDNFEATYPSISKDMIDRMKDQLKMAFIEVNKEKFS